MSWEQFGLLELRLEPGRGQAGTVSPLDTELGLQSACMLLRMISHFSKLLRTAPRGLGFLAPWSP